jgi:hypothetical protein
MDLERMKATRQRLLAGKTLARLKGTPMKIDRARFRSGNIDPSISQSEASSFFRRPLLAHGFFYRGISPSPG